MTIDRRTVLSGLALAGMAPPARAGSVGDWLGGLDMQMRLMSAGIPVRPYSAPSSGMAPTLVPGDVFLADMRDPGKTLRRGDIVVFRGPKDPSVIFVKRLIALPGDRVQMKKGRLILNGRTVERRDAGLFEVKDYAGQAVSWPRYVELLPALDGSPAVEHGILEMSDDGPYDNTPEFEVPAGHSFVMGDNRDNSADSRVDMGHVPIGNIIGRAIYRQRPNPGWLVPQDSVPGLP